MRLRLTVSTWLTTLVLGCVLFASPTQPAVHVAPMDTVGPRPVETQTQSSIIRDYLAGWKSLHQAMSENRPELLDAYFVGQAKQQLMETVREQRALGIHTDYQDASHNIRVLFYSPEGSSIQLIDDVAYEVQVRDGGQSIGSAQIRTQYVAVLTPTESKWKVRIFRGGES